MKAPIHLPFSLLITLVVFNSCRDEDLAPAPEPIWAPVAVVSFMEDPDMSFINATDIANSTFAYQLSSEDFDKPVAEVASVVVNLAYNGGPPLLFGEYAQSELENGKLVSLTGTEAADLFGIPVSDLQLGDVFTFSFSVKTVEGRHHTIYNNNICNLIRVIGDCTLEAYILNPAIAEATASADDRDFSTGTIASDGNDAFTFTLDKRDFSPDASTDAVAVEVAYVDGSTSTTSAFKTLENHTAFPANVSISATEAAALFEKKATDLASDDEFIVRFVFSSARGSFSGYNSPNCGKNFSNTIVHPLHFPFLNPDGTAINPPATPLEGTCSLVIPVIE